jgi:hypothetical protein
MKTLRFLPSVLTVLLLATSARGATLPAAEDTNSAPPRASLVLSGWPVQVQDLRTS